MLGRLLLKFCLLLALVGVLETAVLISPPGRHLLGHTFLEAWRTKHERLMAPGHGRLLVVGGLNVAFGVDSEVLEAATGRPTQNLGLHAGLGLAVMLQEAVAGARAGDLMLLSPEYEHFYGGLLYGEVTLAELIQYDQQPLRYFSSPWQWMTLASNAQTVTSAVTFSAIDQAKAALLRRPAPRIGGDPVYRPDGFDARGDITAHLNLPAKPAEVARNTSAVAGPFNTATTTMIEAASLELRSRGVQLVVVYPAVSASYWKMNRTFAEQVASRLPRDVTVTTPGEWVFQDAWFFDTPYHLTRVGREARTQQLLRVLQAVDARDTDARR